MLASSLLCWLGQKHHNQDIMGSNPGAEGIYNVCKLASVQFKRSVEGSKMEQKHSKWRRWCFQSLPANSILFF